MSIRMLERFWQIPLSEKLTFVSAIGVLGLAALLLRIVPFKWIAPLLGRQLGAVGCVPVIDERQEVRARQIQRAVGRASRIVPFRSDCLPQAVGAAILARFFSVPTAFHLGINLGSEQQIEAHAWIASGRVAVTGGDCFGRFTIISCQVSRSHAETWSHL